MRAYLQKKDGELVNVNVFSAFEGFRTLGIETIPFVAEEVDALPLSRETIVHGFVTPVRRALARLGVAHPEVHPLPPRLEPFFGREVRETTLKEIRRLETPIFLKPLADHKAFAGYVRARDVDDLQRSSHLPARDHFALSSSTRT